MGKHIEHYHRTITFDSLLGGGMPLLWTMLGPCIDLYIVSRGRSWRPRGTPGHEEDPKEYETITIASCTCTFASHFFICTIYQLSTCITLRIHAFPSTTLCHILLKLWARTRVCQVDWWWLVSGKPHEVRRDEAVLLRMFELLCSHPVAVNILSQRTHEARACGAPGRAADE